MQLKPIIGSTIFNLDLALGRRVINLIQWALWTGDLDLNASSWQVNELAGVCFCKI